MNDVYYIGETREYVGYDYERAGDDYWSSTANRVTWGDIAHRASGAVPYQRDVLSVNVGELTRTSADYGHRRRPRLVVDGTEVEETLKERLTRETDELVAAAAMITEKLGRRAQQLEHLKRFPDEDPFPDGAILRFHKTFPGSEQKYTYVAARVNDLWYVTGVRSPDGVTWKKFVDWMGLGVSEIYQVRGNRKVIG